MISFDFDCTLTEPAVQDIAEEIKRSGIGIAIVTSRSMSGDNADLFKVAVKLGITDVYFTEYKSKAKFFEARPEFVCHVDDFYLEVDAINSSDCNAAGVDWIKDPDWIEKVYELQQKILLAKHY